MKSTKTQDITYIYAARELCLLKSKPKSKVNVYWKFSISFLFQVMWDNMVDKLKGLSDHDLLQRTYVSTQDENPFADSSFVPYKIVCAYCWILWVEIV